MLRYIPTWFAFLIAFSLGIVLYGSFSPRPLHRPLTDYIWLDRLPEEPTDPFKAYYFSSDGAVMVDAPSCYKVVLEIFEFKADGKNIIYNFLHDGRRANSGYVIERMDRPTKDFDTRLTLAKDPNNKNKKTIYFTGPNMRSQDTLPLLVRQALEREKIRF